VLFALLVFFGLMIRIALRPFFTAFRNLAVQGASDADNIAMQASLAKVRVWVLGIWFGLLVQAYLGVSKPLSPEQLALLF